MHVLALDGVYARHEGVPRFYKSEPISDCEVGALIEGIARKVIDHLKKKGYLDQDGTQVLNPQLDPLFGDNEAIREATVSSHLIGRRSPFALKSARDSSLNRRMVSGGS